MSVDIVVKNCKLVRPEGITTEGIAIRGEKIVTLADPDILPEAKKIIDAEGNFVLPGIIDNHVHLGGHHSLDEDTRVDTAAAAYGGVTTVANTIGVGICGHIGSYTEVFDKWKEIQEKNATTDFVMTLNIFSDIQLRELHLAAGKWGISSFKISLAYKGYEAEQTGVVAADDGRVYLALKSIADLGQPARLLFHCENADIIKQLAPRIRDDEHRQDLAAWTDSRPGWTEALDIERAASIARIVKAPIYIVHLSSAEGVDTVSKARAEGVDIIAETCPPYLTLTKYDPIGVLGKVNPPLRDQVSIERLWEGIRSGLVQCMGTDHASGMRKDKQNIWTGYPGNPCIENYLPIMLSEGVNKGRITLEKLVEVCCANNAKSMGIYPKKGVIQVGSDADLVIVDLNKRVRLGAQSLHQFSDYCLYEGWEVKGYPVLTMLRGNIIVENGKLLVNPGVGRYLPRFL
jgi:dihydropyrimidinase